MSETVNKVRTEFEAVDKGLGAHQARLGAMFEKGARQVEGFKDRIAEFRREQGLTTMAALGLGVGLGAWLEKAKEVEAEYGKAKKGIAGVLSGALEFSKGTTEIERYTQSLKISGEITEKVEDTAARFNMQFEDTATVYKKLALAAGGLGLSQKQVSDLMVGTAATAARFQVSGEAAANAIARAMKTGAVRGVDEFSIALGRAIGNMRKLNQEQRFEHISKALQGSTQIADVMAGGLGGVLGRIRNEVNKTFRELTSPIFGEIAKRLEAWGKHLREARDGAKPLIDEISGKLLTSFKTIADVMATIKEHWMAIAAATAAMKVGNLATTLAGAAAGLSGGGGIGSLAMGGVAGGAGAIARIAKLSVVAETAYFAGAAIGELLGHVVIDKGVEEMRRSNDIAGKLAILGSMVKGGASAQFTEAQSAKARKAVDALEKFGIITSDAAGKFGVNKARLQEDFSIIGRRFEGDGIAKYFGVKWQGNAAADAAATEKIGGTLQNLFAMIGSKVISAPGGGDEASRKFAKQVVNNNFNGGIHVTWKNEEEDPDRAFVRFVDHVENYAHKRTQARSSEALGD